MIEDPFDAGLTSGLFDDPETRAIFGSDAMLHRFGLFEAALACAQAAEGVIAQRDAKAIAAGVEEFEPDLEAMRAAMLRDGLAVPEYVRQLRATLPAECADALHLGATSQDLIDTAYVMALREVNDRLTQRLAALMDAFGRLEVRFGDASLMGRTRMQAALPIDVRQRLHQWRAPFEALQKMLVHDRPVLESLQLGGPVGDRRGMNGKGAEVAARMARRLGLSDAPCWHTERSRFVRCGSWLAQLSAAGGRIGLDIALMVQQGIGAATLSGGGGSSAMAHKQNPVVAEALVTLAQEAAMLAGGLNHAMLHEQERSGIAWAMEWLTLPRLCVIAGASTSGALRLLQSLDSLGESV